MVLSGIRPSFPGLSRSARQITHVLLTRSPLEYPASRAFPFDLHVLSTPPAFVLSQDQTLHKKCHQTHGEPENQAKKTKITDKRIEKRINKSHQPTPTTKTVVSHRPTQSTSLKNFSTLYSSAQQAPLQGHSCWDTHITYRGHVNPTLA